MAEQDIGSNLERVREAISRACARAGRSPAGVLLVAVSKTVEVERIERAIAAGVPALGENRVQEAREKIETLGRPVSGPARSSRCSMPSPARAGSGSAG